MVDAEVRHYAKVLEACVKLKGLTAREVDRRTGQGEGTFKRIFNGVIDLKVRHIFMILGVLDMPEEQFYQLVRTTRGNPGDGAGILEAFSRLGVGPKLEASERQASPSPSAEELERQIEAAIDRVMKRRAGDDGKRDKPAAKSDAKPSRPRRRRDETG